ncbi:MAG: Uncharacterized protein Greene101415_1220, partial [Parcubacteria group bacterium Greene1014_15]
MNIIKRDIFDEISDYLDTSEIVVVHGARQVGKTSLLYYVQSFLKEKGKMCLYIDLEDSRLTAILDSGVDEFVKYLREEGVYRGDGNEEAVYVFIDEIQYLANPSSFLKIVADHHRALKLIVSGSSSFAIKNKFKDSLVGRTVNFELFPLSFREFLTFKEYRHDRAVLKHVDITDKRREELCALYEEYVLYGGYPKIVLEPSVERKERYLQQIIDTYIRKDIKDLAHIKEVDKFNKLVEVLASQSGNMLSLTELSNTCALAKQTVAQYLFILENTYVLRLVKPYHKNLRSELFKTPKIFFYDTGLMQLLWLKQLQKEVLGNVLETAVFSDLVKYYGKD